MILGESPPGCLKAFSSDLLDQEFGYRFYNLLDRRRKQLFIGFLLLFAVSSVLYYFHFRFLLRVQTTEGLEFRRNNWWELLIASQAKINTTESTTSCLNTFQGKMFITDDQGYTCKRDNFDKEREGCCERETSKRFSCSNCEEGCCNEFETCVSCCLGPSNAENIREKQQAFDPQRGNFTNSQTFELCTALCRVYSGSILPDHSFSRPEAKYCFGKSVQ